MHAPTPGLESLTPDLALAIFSHLSPRDLSAAAAVSTHCRRLAHDDLLWRRFTPAPPGRCREIHLREIAWRTAHAVHSAVRISKPTHAVKLIGSNIVLATSLVEAPRSRMNLIFLGSPPEPVPAAYVRSQSMDEQGLHLLETALPLLSGCIVNVALTYDDTQSCVLCACVYRNSTGSTTVLALDTALDATARRCFRMLCSSRLAGVTKAAVSPGKGGWPTCFALLVGTDRGATFVGRNMRRLCEMAPLGQRVTAAAFGANGTAVFGSDGGNVMCVDINTGRRQANLIGPCSCTVSALAVAANGVVVAGIAHRVAGNGHGSLAVAWDGRTGVRLAAFERGSAGSSAILAVPVKAVCIAKSGRRVALLTVDEVSVYDMASWSCVVRAALVGKAEAMDIDDERLAVFCRTGFVGGWLHVLDFAKAVDRMPHEVDCFESADGGSVKGGARDCH